MLSEFTSPSIRLHDILFSSLVLICLLSVANAQACSPEPTPIVLNRDCPERDDLFPNFEFSLIGNLVKSIQRVGPGIIQFEIQNINNSPSIKYQVVRCGCDPNVVEEDSERIRIFTQPTGVYLDSGPVLGLYLALFPAGDRIAEVDEKDKVFSANVREGIDNRSISTLGFDRDDGLPRFESFDGNVATAIISLDSAAKYLRLRANPNTVIPPALVLPIENTDSPLERAECLILIALLFDRVEEAVRMFNEVRARYERVKIVASERSVRRPSVFFNYPILANNEFVAGIDSDAQFNWDQPTSSSYLITLLSDARADYRLASREGPSPTQLSFTEIGTNFNSAKFLLNSGRQDVFSNSRTMDNFINEPVDSKLIDEEGEFLDREFNDEVAKDLVASLCNNVWSDQKRFRDTATDFDEAGAFQPDVILTDFVKILHPYITQLSESEIRFQYNYEDAGDTIVGGPCPFVVLEGSPPRGRTFADRQFLVPDLSRFQIEDIAKGVIDTLAGRLGFINIGTRDLELFFPAEMMGSRETVITIRASVLSSNATFFRESGIVLDALQESVSSGVQPTVLPSPSPSPSPSASSSPSASNSLEENGGGLGGGAIFGIVVAVVVVAGVLVYLVIRRRRRSQPVQGGAPIGQEESDWAAGAGSAGVGEQGRIGGRGRERFRLGGRRTGPIPPAPGGGGGAAGDDPFEI